ncbi:hypothetical protein Tco_0709656 [Tanacetum coccineum]
MCLGRPYHFKSQTVTLTPNQILTKELSPDMKKWEELIRENMFGLVGHRDHLPACLAHMLYCVVAEEQYNLAYFFVKRIECARANPTANLPYDGVGARTPYYARKDFLDCHLPREWEIARDAEINPFKDVLVFRRMDKLPKNGDGAWHAKIRLIDPDGEEFTKTFQSVPTSRKLSERDDPKEIIDLDHFYDTLYLMRRSLEVLRKFHWMILGGRFNQLSHVSSPLLSKPGEY